MTPTHASADEGTETSGHLRARFRIEPHEDASCGVVAACEKGDRVTQSIHAGGESCEGGCCRAELVPLDEEPRMVSQAVTEHCICPVLQEYECVASIEAFDRGELVVTISVRDREVLESIVSGLREVGAGIRLIRITQSTEGTSSHADVLEVEADAITEKQREAVALAAEIGYYETPRRADLGDLADRLDISRSAVSQRLTAVESKLIAGFVDSEIEPRRVKH